MFSGVETSEISQNRQREVWFLSQTLITDKAFKVHPVVLFPEQKFNSPCNYTGESNQSIWTKLSINVMKKIANNIFF